MTYTKEQIKSEYLRGNSLRYSCTKNSDVKQFIDKIDLEVSHKEKVYAYVNSVIPQCKSPQCQEIPKFENFKAGYKEYCSVSCAVKNSKDSQEITRLKNIQKLTADMSVNEIVSSLYNKDLNIQKWRDIDKLSKFRGFKSLDQLHKHLIIKDSQICEYCSLPLSVTSNSTRKCNCTTHKERKLHSIISENDADFLSLYITNRLYNNEKSIDYYYSRFQKLSFSESVAEDIYCRVNNITKKPENHKFINLSTGYSKIPEIIDYEKPPTDILNQLKKKHGRYYKKSYDFLYFIKHFEGNTTNEQMINLNNGYFREFKPIENVKYNDVLLKQAEISNVEYISKSQFRCLSCNAEFTQLSNLAKHITCRVCTPKISGYSLQEKEVLAFVKSVYSGVVLENDRSLGKEIDIYLPEIRVGIEFNGLYWHSSKFKDRNYHLSKTEAVEKMGVQLIHIFENEWVKKPEIIKSILRAKLGVISTRFYGRKCELREVTARDSNKFLRDNHVQGADNAKIRFGLYYRDELVQVMTFKRSHRSKDRYMELKRFSSKINTTVVGGFSKLLKHAQSIIREDVVTFADRRFSKKENVYAKFSSEVTISGINYFYCVNGELESREKYQKHKLQGILETFDPDKSESENMSVNGHYKIHDSGNWRYLIPYK